MSLHITLEVKEGVTTGLILLLEGREDLLESSIGEDVLLVLLILKVMLLDVGSDHLSHLSASDGLITLEAEELTKLGGDLGGLSESTGGAGLLALLILASTTATLEGGCESLLMGLGLLGISALKSLKLGLHRAELRLEVSDRGNGSLKNIGEGVVLLGLSGLSDSSLLSRLLDNGFSLLGRRLLRSLGSSSLGSLSGGLVLLHHVTVS